MGTGQGQAIFDYFVCFWDPFLPTGLPCSDMRYVPSHIVNCNAIFVCYSLEACSFLKGKERGVDMGRVGRG